MLTAIPEDAGIPFPTAPTTTADGVNLAANDRAATAATDVLSASRKHPNHVLFGESALGIVRGSFSRSLGPENAEHVTPTDAPP